MARRGGVVLVLGLLTGCVAGFEREELMANLARRAAFDMNCPPAQLTFTELSTNQVGNANTYGVRGCGKQGVYVRPNDHTNWILDSTSRNAR